MKTINKFLFTALPFLLLSCNNDGNYQTSANGLKYEILLDSKGTKAQKGEYISYNTTWRTMSGESIFSTNNTSPISGIVPDSLRYEGDPNEVLTLIGKGDSASVLVSADKFFDGMKFPEHVSKGDMIRLDIKVVDVMNAADYEAFLLANQPVDPEIKAIRAYVAAKGLNAEELPSGLFIITENKGTDKPVMNGQKVSMKYDGHLLDGTPFDSNVDAQFNCITPFSFVLGQHQVISGWDEGITHFGVGGKGKLIVPSKLGYGSQGMPPKIPGNATLVFDIGVVSAE